MKRINLYIIALVALFLAGCSSFYTRDDGYYYSPGSAAPIGYGQHGRYTGPMTPLPHPGSGGKGRPQPYTINQHDQQRYEHLNDQINQRLQTSPSINTSNPHSNTQHNTLDSYNTNTNTNTNTNSVNGSHRDGTISGSSAKQPTKSQDTQSVSDDGF